MQKKYFETDWKLWRIFGSRRDFNLSTTNDKKKKFEGTVHYIVQNILQYHGPYLWTQKSIVWVVEQEKMPAVFQFKKGSKWHYCYFFWKWNYPIGTKKYLCNHGKTNAPTQIFSNNSVKYLKNNPKFEWLWAISVTWNDFNYGLNLTVWTKCGFKDNANYKTQHTVLDLILQF